MRRDLLALAAVLAAVLGMVFLLLARRNSGDAEPPSDLPAGPIPAGPRAQAPPLLRGSAPTAEELLDREEGAPVVPEGVGRAIVPADSEVVGRVVDRDGVSLRGAVVQAFLDRPDGGRDVLGSVGAAAMGRFWLRLSRPAERVHLRILGPSDEEPYAPTIVRDVETGRSAPLLEVDPGVWLEGIVVDSEGQAVDGARVVLWRGGDDPDDVRRRTADGGRFRFGVAPGVHHVFAEPRRAGLVRSSTVEVTAPAGPLQLVCLAGRTIRGHLRGGGVEGFEVGWSLPTSDRGARSGSVRLVGEDGRFVLPDVPPVRIVLYAWSRRDERYALRHVDAQEGGEYELELRPGLAIEGWLPVPSHAGRGLWLQVWDRQVRVWRGVPVASDGSFRVPGLPPGGYDLSLPEHMGVAPLRSVPAGSTGVRLEAVPAAR